MTVTHPKPGIPCLICDQDDPPPGTEVFSDDRWAAGVLTGYDVPGWVILRHRAHVVGLQGLDEKGLSQLGHRLRDLSAAVSDATGAVATYLMAFGEANPHFHVLLTPRTSDVPADRRSGDILRLRTERADPDAALALVPSIRAAYEQHAGVTSGRGR